MLKHVELVLDINKMIHNECKDVPHDIGYRIMELVEATNGWRSVKDEPPEHYEPVLISGKNGILTCCLNSPAWNDSKPTHWMPHPSKPDL